MFYCFDCEAVFERLGSKEVMNIDALGSFPEYWACCPDCGSEDYDEAAQCEECGDWCNPFAIAYFEDLDKQLCPECMREAIKASWKSILKGSAV